MFQMPFGILRHLKILKINICDNQFFMFYCRVPHDSKTTDLRIGQKLWGTVKFTVPHSFCPILLCPSSNSPYP